MPLVCLERVVCEGSERHRCIDLEQGAINRVVNLDDLNAHRGDPTTLGVSAGPACRRSRYVIELTIGETGGARCPVSGPLVSVRKGEGSWDLQVNRPIGDLSC